MVAAPSFAKACSPRRARPHSRFRVSDFRFPVPCAFDLSTAFDSSTFLPSCSLTLLESISMRRPPERKSSGLKLFGMSKCTARAQKNGPRKCPGMCALTKYAGLISFGISVYKEPGGCPRLGSMPPKLR